MAENTGSAAALLGDAGNPSAGGGGSVQGGGAVAAFDWKSSGIDDAGMNVVTTKGFKGPGDLLNSYVNLEKLVGGDKVPWPKDGDEAGWNALYAKMGRPEKPDGYKIPIPEGVPGDFAKSASEAFHKHGLSAKQAEGLGGWWNETMKAQHEAAETAFDARVEKEFGEVKAAWGGAFEQNAEIARRAARQFGIGKEDLESMERGIGTKRTYELLHKIGAGLGEDQGVGATAGQSGFRMSADGARAEISRLKTDAEFMKAYFNADHAAHKDAVAKMENLHKAASGM